MRYPLLLSISDKVQDRYGGHFNLGREAVASAAGKVQDGAQRVKDGARDHLERR